MTRQLFYAHVYAVATEGVFTLNMAIDGPETLEFYRPVLRKLVAHLRFVANTMLTSGAAADFPELYMPVTDAFISLKVAMRGAFIDRDGLLCAAAYLEPIVLTDPRKGGHRHAT